MNKYKNRRVAIIAAVLLVGIAFLVRLFMVQVLNDDYKVFAENNVLQKQIVTPLRGMVYDRDGRVLVNNRVVYDLMVVPKQVQEFDTADFARILGLEVPEIRNRLQKAGSYSRYKPSIFMKALSPETYGNLQERAFQLRGFYVVNSTTRYYPNAVAPHVLGYIGEVNQQVLEGADDWYRMGDYIGISGIEKMYEKELRGEKGVRSMLVDVFNREQGSYMEGQFDVPSQQGASLTSSLDLELQAYGELLMQNKRGSIVAIEPESGEILAMVSAPSYDPNLLQGQHRAKNYVMLAQDTSKPLFNRATDARYRPGSIFKLVQSLIAMEEEVITPNTGFACNRGLIGCHNHPHARSVQDAIKYSCNPYYWQVYKRLIQRGESSSIFVDSRLGLEEWEKHVESFGFGNPLKTDLPSLNAGFVPNVSFYDKWYGERRWAFSTIYSNSIGEGELGVVPIQMANLAAIIANRGWFYTPHLIKSIGDSASVRPEYTKRHYTTVDSQYFPVVIEGMRAVVEEPGGTARRARVDGISICGKTGTVQNVNREDHSVFIAFAPKDNPKIAIAVYVENSGFGGTWAAPIASLMIEQYLNGEISRPEAEKRILEADFINPPEEEKPEASTEPPAIAQLEDE